MDPGRWWNVIKQPGKRSRGAVGSQIFPHSRGGTFLFHYGTNTLKTEGSLNSGSAPTCWEGFSPSHRCSAVFQLLPLPRIISFPFFHVAPQPREGSSHPKLVVLGPVTASDRPRIVMETPQDLPGPDPSCPSRATGASWLLHVLCEEAEFPLGKAASWTRNNHWKGSARAMKIQR